MFRLRFVLLLIAVFASASSVLAANIRVATYNVFFLNKDTNSARAANIRSVSEKPNADVIDLQEIKDRAALELVFDKTKWSLLIDDDSGDDQDVAAAVREAAQGGRAKQ